MGLYMHAPMGNGNSGPRVFHGRQFTHLMADSEQELRAYAVSIGMRERWIQKAGTRQAHFDLTGRFLAKAQADPQVEKVSFRAFVERYTGRKWPAAGVGAGR